MSKHEFGERTKLIHSSCDLPRNRTTFLYTHAIPIANTSTFRFDNIKQARGVFAGEDLSHEAYSRYSNPNYRFLEEKLAVLEGGEAAQVFDSGMTAIEVLLKSLAKSGDRIIAHCNLYGGTYDLFKKWGKFRVETIFINACDIQRVAKYFSKDLIFIFVEPPSNPAMNVPDYPEIKKILQEKGFNDVLVIVDNTFSTPYNQNPLKLGADIVVHSLTKYLNGHGDHIGGAFITSKKIMKKIWDEYRASGGIMAPAVAVEIAKSVLSLKSRMEDHNKNGMAAAEFLDNHPKVKTVYYPGLPHHPGHRIAKKLMRGFGGMISFELKGEQADTEKFLDKLARDSKKGKGVFTLAVSLGAIYSLIICPALTTHFAVPREERLEQGITDNLIRMSVGTENIEDILNSLERGFSVI